MILALLTFVYLICAALLTIYAVSELILLFIYWRWRGSRQPAIRPRVDDWPSVTVQLPIYNERYVVERLLEAVAHLDYPRDRLAVQVLDDSTDDTADIAAAAVRRWRAAGLRIEHLRRGSRQGFKAGALAAGLARTTSDLVAVLDADFVPPSDFLKCIVPYLVADPGLGMVQARWGHLNPFHNLLTLGQTLALDGHFVVEQTARSRAGWLMSFNGSGGVWRTRCIHDAGGWRDDTLTEDLDLSYRAQLAGWRFLYLPEVVIPAELPPYMTAYKQQQARWAQGSTQCLLRILGPLWRSRYPLIQRVMATLHLCQYLPHPLMLALLLLTPPLLIAHGLERLPLSLLGLAGLGPPAVYIVSQRALYPDWPRRLLGFPVLLAIGTGIAWNNTCAVIGGLVGFKGSFHRTPKVGRAARGARYALPRDPNAWVEAGLALYALLGLWLAGRANPPLIPYLAVYSFAFGVVALWSLSENWRESSKVRGYDETGRSVPAN